MIVNGRELFSTPEIDRFTSRIEDKLVETNNKITQLRSDIERCNAEIQTCLTVDILEGTASSKKDLSNVSAKKVNLEVQLEDEIKRAFATKEIMNKEIAKLLPEADKQLRADMIVYNEVIEKEAYREFGELRQKQEELFLTLQVAHNDVINELSKVNEICTVFDLPRYKWSATNDLFHNNLHMAHRSYPEYGVPIIDCNNLQGVEERLFRIWADTNAQANTNLPEEDRIEISQPKKLQDINLQEWIDGIKESKDKK